MTQILRCAIHTVAATVVVGSLVSGGTAAAAVVNVPAGGDLQAYLDAAQPGDVIVLPAGARFVGQFRFGAKGGMVTLTSSGPLPGRRISPADAPLMATIASGVSAMAVDMHDARNWTLDGIRFEPNTGGYGEIIGIERGENIVLKRLLIAVPSSAEQKRFVLGNGRNITLTQSHCAGVWRAGQDSQCFVAWDGAGPYTITDNFLEAASENVMFGGADSHSVDDLPSDIRIEDNVFTKLLAWKGQPRFVKNLLELKAARRVVIRNNLFERNWTDAQSGTAILFTPRNQDGTAPWSVVQDVLFEQNIVRDTPSHFNITGYDDTHPTGQTTNIVIRHNLLIGTGGGRLATIGHEAGTVTLDHNTYINPQPSDSAMVVLHAEGPVASGSGSHWAQFAVSQFTVTNTLAHANAYGLHTAVAAGTAGLNAMAQGWVWTNNVLAGGSGTYPPITTLLPLADYPGQFDANYYLVSTSPFKSMATDGTDLGRNPYSGSPTPPSPTPPPVTIVTTSLAAGRTGTPYAAAFTAGGGSGTVNWSISAGALPAGLSLAANTGEITGTPTKTGSTTFTVRAADATDATNAATGTFTIGITAAITVTTAALPDALRGRAYSATLGAANAQGSVQWTISAGKLPHGLSLNAATGIISGKANGSGTTTFTVTAADATSSGSRSLSLTVARK